MTSGALWAPVLALLALLAILRAIKVNAPWLIAAILYFLAYLAALMFVGRLIPLEAYFGDLSFNWGGKVAGIAVSLLVVAALWALARKTPAESGLTLAQTPGSLAPASAVLVLLVGISIAAQIALGDGGDVSAERLWFQATMPGLDEELFWRGAFLLMLNEAARGGRLNIGGAPISWGGAAGVLLFGLGHGLAIQNGEVMFSALAVAVTGAYGFGLLWLRERTGSILIPILAHNLVNFSGSFF